MKSILNIDETWTKVRIKFKGDKTKLGKYFKKYVWVLVNKAKQITYFFYDNDENDSRGKRPIQTFLGDFFGTYSLMAMWCTRNSPRTIPPTTT